MGIIRTSAVILACALIWTAGPADAHHRDPHREVVIQRDAHGLTGLWRIEVFGRPASLLLAGHDVDRDGRLSSLEGQAVARLLIRRALKGVALRVGKAPLRQESVDMRVDGTPSSSRLAVVALVTYEGVAQGDSLNLEISVSEGALPLGIRLQALPPWAVERGETKSRVMVGSPPTHKRAVPWTPQAPITISPGSSASATLRRR